jgi:hypothetical protein
MMNYRAILDACVLIFDLRSPLAAEHHAATARHVLSAKC